MRVMVLVKANAESEHGVLPNEQQLEDMTAFNEQLVKEGVMLAGEGLHPSSKGARVVFEKGRTTVIDGPFTETKELVAGFWIWQVRSLEEAVEWAKRIPGTAIIPGTRTGCKNNPSGSLTLGGEGVSEPRA